MPINYSDTSVRFEGTCTVEEALEFSGWHHGRDEASVDLAACEHMHAALLQCCLALTPTLTARPEDPFLARALAALPDAGDAAAEDNSTKTEEE